MTGCPDWNVLVLHRERDGAAPEGWTAALEHFDACRECRREALAADPLLVFRRLPAPAVSPAEERSAVESMRQAVAAMRTAERLESGRRFAGWRRWGAAAVLAVASLSVSWDKAPEAEYVARVYEPESPIESLDPDARVYVEYSGDMPVVMYVNPRFPDHVR